MEISVVIVDDSKTDRYLARRIVGKAAGERNVRIVEFDSGDEFVEAVKNDQQRNDQIGAGPFLVFLDINMPGMSGFEVLEFLREQLGESEFLQGVTVMMYSSSSHTEDQADALNFPFVKGYVIKPLARDTCAQILDDLFSENSES